MKKAVLLFILSLFATMLFAGIAYSADTPTTTYYLNAQERAAYGSSQSAAKMAITTISDVLKIIEGILGTVFSMISTTPSVWLKVMFFIAIYAILFQVLTIKATEKIIDRKTAGILGFVLAFGSVAIMPSEWLYLILNMYSGLIMTLILLLPLIWGLLKTKDAMKAKTKGIAMVLVALGWVLYLLILSTAFSALRKIGLQDGGPLMWFQSFALIVAVIMIIVCLALAFTGQADKTPRQIGKKAWDLFSLGGGNDFKTVWTTAKNLANNLKSAQTQAEKNKDTGCINASTMAMNVLAEFEDHGIPFLEKKIKEIENLGAERKENRDNMEHLTKIQDCLQQITELVGTEVLTIKIKATPIDFTAIAKDLNTAAGVAGDIATQIDEIEDSYIKTEKAAAKNP